MMREEQKHLMVTGEIVVDLIEAKRQADAVLWLEYASSIGIVGFNADPDGITQSSLKLDKYEQAFPIPLPSRPQLDTGFTRHSKFVLLFQ